VIGSGEQQLLWEVFDATEKKNNNECKQITMTITIPPLLKKPFAFGLGLEADIPGSTLSPRWTFGLGGGQDNLKRTK
jgi:hypothetical protein